MGATSIVMAVSTHPEKIGLVESLARPGGNVTGLSNIAPELRAPSPRRPLQSEREHPASLALAEVEGGYDA